MINIKKILVPIDFSSATDLLLKYAAIFSAEFGSEIHLLHVIEEEIFHPGNLDDPLHTAEKWESEALQKMKALISKEPYSSLPIYCSVRGGLIYQTIIDEAKEKNIDLIIIASYGQSGFIDSWLGGTTYEVTKKAPCPVLTVKPSDISFF